MMDRWLLMDDGLVYCVSKCIVVCHCVSARVCFVPHIAVRSS